MHSSQRAGLPALSRPGTFTKVYTTDRKVVKPMGAVAIDDESGRGGTVENRESEGIARDIATDLCRKNGGNNCKVLIAYHDQCAALAQTLGGGKIFATSAVNSQKAERMALDNCNSDRCAIIYSKCSLAQPTD